MAFAKEVAVFVETNLGTRIVMAVPLDITPADFKRKLEKTHASCLPSLGEIRVHGLMVQLKSQFYYIAESVPVKYVFRDNQKPWFINAEARLVNIQQEPNSIDKFLIGHCSDSDIHGVNKKTKKSLAKPIPKPETIIRAAGLNNSECFIPKTLERETVEPVSICETISKKLIVAANNIRMQGKSRMPSSLSSSIFRSKTRRNTCIEGKTLASLAKFLVFEIPDTED